jgi:hypothetical protein
VAWRNGGQDQNPQRWHDQVDRGAECEQAGYEGPGIDGVSRGVSRCEDTEHAHGEQGTPGDDDRPAETDGETADEQGGGQAAHAESESDEPGAQRRVPPAVLQPQGVHEDESAVSGERDHLHDQPGGEGPDAEHAGRQQRGIAGLAVMCLGKRQRHHGEHPGGQAWPAPGGPAVAAAFQQGEDDGDQARGEHAGGQQARPPAARHARLWHEPGPEGEQHDSDGHVDDEDRAPPQAGEVSGDQHAAESHAQGLGEPAGYAEEAEDRAAFPALEAALQGAQGLRGDAGGGQPLRGPGRDQLRRVVREAAQQARHPEGCHCGEKDPFAARHVPQPGGCDQRDGEGQQVSGRDPLQFRWICVQVPLNGGQRDVDDRGVEQIHERGRDQHDRRRPAMWSQCRWRGLGARVGGCGGVGRHGSAPGVAGGIKLRRTGKVARASMSVIRICRPNDSVV